MTTLKQQQDGRILAVVGGVVVLIAAALIIAGVFERTRVADATVQKSITASATVAAPPLAAASSSSGAGAKAAAAAAGNKMAFGNTIDSLRQFAKKYPDDPLVQAMRNPQFGDADVLPYGNSDKGLMGGQKLRNEVARIRRINAFEHTNTAGVIAAQRVVGDRCAVQFGHNEKMYTDCKNAQKNAQHKAFASVAPDAGNARCGMLNPEGVQNTMINIPAAAS
jgi:hypothetical protein